MARTNQEIEDIVNFCGYELLEIYIYKTKRIIFKDKHGYKYDSNFSQTFLRRKPCLVGKNNPFSLYNISIWLVLNNKNFYLCNESSAYLNDKQKLKFYCRDCADFFYMDWNHISNSTNKQGCAVCSGHQVGERHSLAYLMPEFLKEWNFEENNKNNIFPDKITCGNNKKVSWICDKGHIWLSHVHRRTMRGDKCPNCETSKGEQKIYNWIEENYSVLKQNGLLEFTYQKTFSDCIDIRKLSFDFGLLYYRI